MRHCWHVPPMRWKHVTDGRHTWTALVYFDQPALLGERNGAEAADGPATDDDGLAGRWRCVHFRGVQSEADGGDVRYGLASRVPRRRGSRGAYHRRTRSVCDVCSHRGGAPTCEEDEDGV